MNNFKKSCLLFFLLVGLDTLFAQNYIFYLHGKIVENQGANAKEIVNGYGTYEYYAILDSLKRNGNKVLSEVRAKDTDVKVYAVKIKNQIDSLLKTGVKAQSISVLGASKGALIAMYVSTYLKNADLNFIFMAACYSDSVEPDLNCFGNILSIYEESDLAGTCTTLKLNSKGIKHYKEIKLSTGMRHGFLFKPLSVWLNPSLEWANANYK